MDTTTFRLSDHADQSSFDAPKNGRTSYVTDLYYHFCIVPTVVIRRSIGLPVFLTAVSCVCVWIISIQSDEPYGTKRYVAMAVAAVAFVAAAIERIDRVIRTRLLLLRALEKTSIESLVFAAELNNETGPSEKKALAQHKSFCDEYTNHVYLRFLGHPSRWQFERCGLLLYSIVREGDWAISEYERVGVMLRTATLANAMNTFKEAASVLIALSERLQKNKKLLQIGHKGGKLKRLYHLAAFIERLDRLVADNNQTFEDAEAICMATREAWLAVLPAILDLDFPFDDLLNQLAQSLRAAKHTVENTQFAEQDPRYVAILKHYQQNITRRADLVDAFRARDKPRLFQSLKKIISEDHVA